MAKKTGTAVTTWDEELAKQADIAAAQSAAVVTGAKFFSLKSGVLSFNNTPFPNNEMAVIILDGCFANTHYAGKFDPATPAGPDCYAFGKALGVQSLEMIPHTDCGDGKHSDRCATCPFNEWGSADEGKGKACKNGYRLAMIPAGNFDAKGKLKAFAEESEVAANDQAYMMLPVTSVKDFLTYQTQLSAGVWTGGKRLPPHGVITKIKLVPDAANQFKIKFDFLSLIPGDLMGTVMRRHKEAEDSIMFPYPKNSNVAPAAKVTKAPAKKLSKKEATASKARKY